MRYKKLIQIFLVIALAVAFSPVNAQNSSPSKYTIKKDTDKDGVKNKRDKCPGTPPGVFVDGTGCPLDTDKDGIPDYLDRCPSVPGSKDLNGCQDKDSDGVSDNEDNCPDIPGLARFQGCPDSDGDGIEDSKDICPNAKGSDLFQGCPDTDGDGIVDASDKCPDTRKGIKVDGNGCPADTDKDGITDTDDKCPNTPVGVKVDAKGCPADTDGDGVADVNDRCPNVRGDLSNGGCPVVKKEIAKRLNFAARRISFESGSALLKVASYPTLDEVASILNEYPDYNLRISGNTDAVEKNPVTVSQSRADAVKSYLLSKGVPESRTVTQSFGKTRPLASNLKVATRTLNRRVDLELYLR